MTCEFCEKRATTTHRNTMGDFFDVCDFCELDLIAADLRQKFQELRQTIIEKDLCVTHPAFENILRIQV